MVAHGVDVPIEFGEGATLEKAFIGRHVWRRGQIRVHGRRSYVAAEGATRKTASSRVFVDVGRSRKFVVEARRAKTLG